MVLGAQPIIAPDELKPHLRTGLRIVRPLLRHAGMSDADLNDPNGLAFPKWGGIYLFKVNITSRILTYSFILRRCDEILRVDCSSRFLRKDGWSPIRFKQLSRIAGKLIYTLMHTRTRTHLYNLAGDRS